MFLSRGKSLRALIATTMLILISSAAAQSGAGGRCLKPKSSGLLCKGPLTGASDRQEPRWYYNDKYQMCISFTYNGCNGNDNNFLSKEECEFSCKPADGMDCANGQPPNGECSAFKSCPSGFVCTHGAFNQVCCEEEFEKRFREELRPKCPRGNVYTLGSQSKHPLLADSCNELACPRGYRCVTGKLFAHCCPDDDPFGTSNIRNSGSISQGENGNSRTGILFPRFVRPGTVTQVWPPTQNRPHLPITSRGQPANSRVAGLRPGSVERNGNTRLVKWLTTTSSPTPTPAPVGTTSSRFIQGGAGRGSIVFGGRGSTNVGSPLSRPVASNSGFGVFGAPMVAGHSHNQAGYDSRCYNRVPAWVQPLGIRPTPRWYHDAFRNGCYMFYPNTFTQLNGYFRSVNECLRACLQTSFS